MGHLTSKKRETQNRSLKITIEKTRSSLFKKEGRGNPKLLRSVRTPSLLKRIRECAAGKDALSTPILPPGTVLYEKRGDREAIILQEQPGVRVVRWHNSDYALAFPYVILGFGGAEGYYDLDGVLVYYAARSIASRQDALLRTNLPNVNTGYVGRICMYPGSPPEGNIYEAARLTREAFWHHAFNGNVRSDYDELADRTTGEFEQWSQRSEKDPLFALKVRWPGARLTVGELANQLLGDDEDDEERRQLRTIDDLVDLFGDIEEDDPWAI